MAAPTAVTKLRGRFADVTLGLGGDPTILGRAYEGQQPVTVEHGTFAGETVYLGHAELEYDLDADGVTSKTYALYETRQHPQLGTVAIYLIDETRLQGAPKLAAMLRDARNRTARRAMENDDRIQAEARRIEEEC